MSARKVALVVGAGPGLGASVCRVFAKGGYDVVALRRRHGDELEALCKELRELGVAAHGLEVDVRSEEAVEALFDRVESEVGEIDVVVFNPGANVNFPIRDTTVRVFTKVWEMACFAGFLVGREAAKRMVPRGRGTILFTGATASVRGNPGFAAFASAKAGLRNLAQSMARELGREGIHVAHVVVDGGIDGAFIRGLMGDALAERPPDSILDPDHIAETYWAIHRQKRSAWTFEADVRPWVEHW